MANTLVKTVPDFQTTLASRVSVGDTTATLTTATDDDGVALPTGTYAFTIDRKNSSKEYIECTLTGTSLTGIKTIARGTGVATSGFARSHRKGAEVIISDFVIIKRLTDLLDGTTDLNASTPLEYDGTATINSANQLATKAYVDGVAIAGGADASTTVKGITKMSVAPASASNPIAVGDNDPRVPSQGENDALAGTSGTPSASNKYVTNDDTDGTGDVVRSSLLANFITAKANFMAGEALTADDALHVTRYAQSDGGITYDNSKITGYAGTTNPSDTFSVAAGNNRLLLVAVGSTGSVSAVTYNGVSMTLVDSSTYVTNGSTVYLYRLVAPATGSNTVQVTGTSVFEIGCLSLQNVDQTTPIDASAKANGASWTPTVSVTSVTSGALFAVFGFGAGGSGSFTSPTATAPSKYVSSNTLSNIQSTSNSNVAMVFGHTGKVNEAQALSLTASWSWSGGGTPGGASIGVAIRPATTVAIGVVKSNSSSISFNEPLIDFIGFADSTVSAGATVSVTYGGIYNSLSGLTAGRKYYLRNTNGAIGTSQNGSYGKIVGLALSETTLLILPEKTMSTTAISKANSYNYTAECDGIAGTTTSTFPVARGQTYTFSAGTNQFTALA